MAFKSMGVIVAGSKLAASKKDYATGTALHELIQVRAKKHEMVFFLPLFNKDGHFLDKDKYFQNNLGYSFVTGNYHNA